MNYLIVQLSAKEVIFSRFQSKGRELVFVEASRDSIDADRPFASLLQEIKAKGGKGKKSSSPSPLPLFFMREIELPITDRRKVREVLPWR